MKINLMNYGSNTINFKALHISNDEQTCKALENMIGNRESSYKIIDDAFQKLEKASEGEDWYLKGKHEDVEDTSDSRFVTPKIGITIQGKNHRLLAKSSDQTIRPYTQDSDLQYLLNDLLGKVKSTLEKPDLLSKLIEKYK